MWHEKEERLGLSGRRGWISNATFAFSPPWCSPGQYSELVGRLIEYAISLALLITVIM
jgi:hypothetical protein